MTSLFKKLVFASVPLVVFLGLSEFVLRKTHLFGARISWCQPDSTLGYRFVPGAEYWHIEENDHAITGRISSFGWRTREIGGHKPPDVFRVAILGDSYVEAFQVESERTFISLAERSLSEATGGKVEFMNFGRSSCTQTEEYLILQHDVVKFSPDAVVLHFTTENDVEDVSRITANNTLRPFFTITDDDRLELDTSFTQRRSYRLQKLINPLKSRSAFVSLMTERYNKWRRRSPENPNIGKGPPTPSLDRTLSICTSSPDSQCLRNYQLNKRIIREMAGFCRSRGITFVLAVNDNKAYRTEVEGALRQRDPSFDPDFFQEDLRKLAVDLDVSFVGLQTPFRRRYEETGTPLHWGHWNYEGHELVAQELAKVLRVEWARWREACSLDPACQESGDRRMPFRD